MLKKVQVMEDRGDWVHVRLSRGGGGAAVEGWLKTEHLHKVDEGEAQDDRSAAVSKKRHVSPPYPGKPDGPRPMPDTESSLQSALHPVVPDIPALPPLPHGTPLQRRQITIYTFGLQNWAGVRARHAQHDVLKRLFKFRGIGDVGIFNNTLLFNARTCTGHIGIHPEILLNITWDESFPAWLQLLRDNILESLAHSSNITVAFFCRHGTHRSVAGAYFLQHIAEQQGWTTCTRHLCEDHWAHTCKGQCRDCVSGSASRVRALNWAWDRWQHSR